MSTRTRPATNSPQAERRGWRLPLALMLAAGGVIAVIASVFAPVGWMRDGRWSEQDATAYQKTSAELHRLTVGGASDRETAQQLRESREAFADLDSRLRSSAEAAESRRLWLRWGGVAALALGALGSRTN